MVDKVLDISHGQKVQHLRRIPGVKNSHGIVKDLWADPVAYENVGVDVPSSTESGPQTAGGGMDRQVVDLVAFMPHGFECSKMDRMIVGGRTYEVQGDAVQVKNFFTGSLFPTPVNLRRIDG